ncbi:inorganic phosphate transporter [Candidatus Gracilibacteria bacterium]|nr:inorganic phosphate transporter [Candidatus Gracilibacteria bacterium]
MTQKIEQFLDNIQMQTTLGKLLLPVIFLFIITMCVIFFSGGGSTVALPLVIAAMLAFYLAINIGANDVANNMGPAVGSKAITIGGAIIIAAVFEASGAIIAGGDVVNTIKGGIIDASGVTDPAIFISIMLATLFGSAVWINIATYTKSPVSATHSVIGGLVGAGIIALGVDVINWEKIMQIVASWVISPLLGGSIAAFLLWSIDTSIMNKESRHDAAQKWVPVYVALMGGAFSGYLLLKGLKKVVPVTELQAALFGLGVAILTYIVVRKILKKHTDLFKNSKKSINRLFNLPLVFSAALLSFAHGANDVANAIGPFAAIYDSVTSGGVSLGETGIPLWIMIIGALGLAIGLGVYGSTLIKTVGNEITKLNQVRAYCVALSAAITVIIASGLGLPVSSTHIAIGGIFGIGFYREVRRKYSIKTNKQYLDKSMLRQIILSWIITLPASAFIAAISYTSIIFFVSK